MHIPTEWAGAISAAIAAVGYGARSVVDSLSNRRKAESQDKRTQSVERLADGRHANEALSLCLQHLAALTAEVSQLRLRIDDRDAKVESLQAQVHDLQAERDSLTSDLAEAREELQCARDEIEASMAECRELKAELVRLQTEGCAFAKSGGQCGLVADNHR